MAFLCCRFIPAALAQKQASAAELVCADVLSCVRATTRLFDANATPDNGVPAMMAEDMPQVVATVELWFQFAVIWGIGGPLSAAGQSGYGKYDSAYLLCLSGWLQTTYQLYTDLSYQMCLQEVDHH